MSMLRATLLSLTLILPIAGATSTLAASSEADFKTAYAAAEAANKEAASLRNQWTTTAAALAAAKKAAEVQPLGLIDPLEIAHAALFLASDESRSITGEILAITGGR